MKDKQNVNYFMKSGWMKPTGLGLLIAGIAFLFFGWGFISYILMVVFIPAGIVLFIVGASTRSTDAEMVRLDPMERACPESVSFWLVRKRIFF